ncbi:MAG TPA: hypothetical protein VGB76_05460 [Pyrinomonadaceae bacterium]
MSQFRTFEIYFDNDDGTVSDVANQTVHVYDVTNGVARDDLVSDANGTVAGGALAVDAGTLIRFAVVRADGCSRCAEQETI